MKLNYQIILALLVVAGGLAFLWNSFFSSIDTRYVNVGDSYLGIAVGDSKSQSVKTIMSSEISKDIEKATCVSVDGNVRDIYSQSVEANSNDISSQLVGCDQITFYFSRTRPDYLLLIFDEKSKVKEIHRFRYWTEG